MDRQRKSLYIFLAIMTFSMFFGCNRTNEDISSTQESGELALKINWDINDLDSQNNIKHRFDCKKNKIQKVEVIIFNQNGNKIQSESWDCQNHKGSIKGISEGTINLLLLAKDENGGVLYRGMKNMITVIPGDTKEVSITTTQFMPTPLFPETKTCATNPVLSWKGVQGAAEYHVFISNNKEVENIAPIIVTEETYSPPNIQENTKYYWFIRAKDIQGNSSRDSEVFNFSTNKRNTLKDILPIISSSDPSNFTEVNNKVFFTALGMSETRELWISDTTAHGTYSLKQCESGNDSCSISNLIEFKGDLFFEVEDHNSRGLWRSNGTEAGTILLKNFNTSHKYDWDLNQKYMGDLYFSAKTNENGLELWRTDGTETGTTLFKNIAPDNSQIDSNPRNFFTADITTTSGIKNYLFFTAHDGEKEKIWRTDGTEAGTTIVTDKGYVYSAIVVLDGSLIYQDGGNCSLWKIDGSVNGVSEKLNIYPERCSIEEKTVIGNILYFFVDEKELWKSNGTTEGTNLVHKFTTDGIDRPNLTLFNGNLYFKGYDKERGYEFWKSDGTTKGTFYIKDILPGAEWSSPSNFFVSNNFLYFSAFDIDSGRELWQSNGTNSGTILIKDTLPGKLSGDPYAFSNIISTNSFFFSADDGNHGRELWISEGEGNNQRIYMLKDINENNIDIRPDELTVFKNNLLFTASDGMTGVELWKSDGTNQGTNIVKDISLSKGSYPTNLTVLNNTLYFFADDGKSLGLWKSNGQNESTTLIYSSFGNYNWPPINSYPPSNLTTANNLIFFTAKDRTHGEELWRSDGTEKGTFALNITPSSQNSYPQSLLSIGDKLFFTAVNAVWTSDGTLKETKKNKYFLTKSLVQNLVTMGDENIFFLAQKGLWKFNTNNKEMSMICELSEHSNLSVSKDRLFFLGKNSKNSGLWISNGTHEGTTHLKSYNDLHNGTNNILFLSNFTYVDNGYYFILIKQGSGEWVGDLWYTEGSTENTRLVKDNIWTVKFMHDSDLRNSIPFELRNVIQKQIVASDNRLYFKAFNEGTGKELWVTEGTPESTKLIWDINPGSEDGNPEHLTLFNGALYFTAYDKEVGGEIRSICLDNIEF